MNARKVSTRLLSFLLAFCMVFGMLPVTALTADAETTVLDAAIFCSDVHDSTTSVSNVFGQIKSSGLTYTTATFCGDTFTDVSTSKSTVTTAAQSALGSTNTQCFYAWGDHDSKSDISDDSGLVYGTGEDENYYIYVLSMADLDNDYDADEAAAEMAEFTDAVAAMDHTKPLFIASHQPLHARRSDNIRAEEWTNVINAAGEKMDIVFFWGHNHTGDGTIDRNVYYVAKNQTLNVETLEGAKNSQSGAGTSSSDTGKDVTIKFTYMNAGYIGKSAGRGGLATTVQITADSLIFQDYNASGAYSGTYAHNVTVDRQFAGTESVPETSEPETEPVVTPVSLAVTATTAYVVGEKLADPTEIVVTYSDETVQKLTEGTASLDNLTAKVTDANGAEVDMENGFTEAGEYTVSYTYTVTVDGTSYEATADVAVTVTAPVVIDNIVVYQMPDKVEYTVGETFEPTGMIVKAVYSDESSVVITDYEFSVDDMTNAGTKTVTVSYNGHTTTFQITVNEVETSEPETSEPETSEPETSAYITKIAVTTLPTKTTYDVSEELDTTGMVVTATYTDGTTGVLTGWYTSEVDTSTEGEKDVTVYYRDNGTTFNASFKITVVQQAAADAVLESIEITTPPTTTTYTCYGFLDLTGLVVTAKYSDGTSIVLGSALEDNDDDGESDGIGYTVDYNTYLAGPQTVTVSYTDGDVTQTATFTVTFEVGYANVAYFHAVGSTNTNVAAAMETLGHENYVAYDLSGTIEEGKNAVVSVAVPSEWANFNTFTAYCVSDEGEVTDTIAAAYADGIVTFETTHFSTWAVVGYAATAASTTTTYTYTSTATADGSTGYILVSNGYALQNNSGKISAVAVTVSGDTVTLDSSVDVSTILWTIDSDGDIMNNGYYLLRASGSNAVAVTISTSDSGDAYSNWTYANDTLTVVGGSNSNTTYYVYYNTSNSAFYTYPSTSQELKFYVASTSTDSGNDGDDTTTGEETTVTGNVATNTATDGSYQTVTVTTTQETSTEKTVYVLTSSISSGNSYLIVNGNAAGSYYALARSSSSVSATGVTVQTGTLTLTDGSTTTATYIELTNADDELWTVSGSNSTTLKNGNYYLRYNNNNLSLNTSNSTTWTYSNNRLSYTSDGNNSRTYYLRYNNGWTTTNESNRATSIYFYVPTTVTVKTSESTSETYSVSASNIDYVYTDSTEDTETATITPSVDSAISGGTYSYTVVSDESGIISSIANDGTITFTGEVGTATVKVAYTFKVDDTECIIWNTITVTAKEPEYELVLHLAEYTYNEVSITAFVEGTTYYVKNDDGSYSEVAADAAFDANTTYYVLGDVSVGAEIEETIALKGVEVGETYSVWAVIKEYTNQYPNGHDLGDVEDDRIYWTVSDTSMATVDTHTGVITFTGSSYGTFTVTAYYLAEDGKTILAQDTVTISITESQYVVPGDGTNDFPEYPNEGAVRFDKTATAVGNFSETGIAMVELSMTGVPYSTGSELDVVIMLDMTGSMTSAAMSAAEAAAVAFADQIVLNEDGSYNSNRIAVECFTTNGVTELWALSAVTADTYDDLVTAIESASTKQASGGTPYSTALQSCYQILYAASKAENYDRQQFCVFVSDGTPTKVTYITNSTTPTTTTNISFTLDGTTYTQTVPAYSTGSTAATFYASTSYHEYWSQLMINNGVTVYGVYTSVAAGTSGSGSGSGSGNNTSVNDTTEGTYAMTNVASSADNVYVVEDYTDTSAVEGALTSIAKKIVQAATNVVVEDMIGSNYTVNFSIPDGITSTETDGLSEFYIQILEYNLDSNKMRTGDPTVLENFTFNADGTLKSHTLAGAACGDTCSHVTFTNGVITKIEGTYFTYEVTSDGEILTWKSDKISTTELVMQYFVYLEDSAGTDVEDQVAAGTYYTNEYATLTYTNYNGKDVQQEFPIPQMTWNGAQVTYVFYLVNEAGQPVNRAGRVVPFAEAVYVTDTFTYSVIWNDLEQSAGLYANYLAESLVPDVYALYDDDASYMIHVYEDEDAVNLNNHFVIGGDVSDEYNTDESWTNANTTYVFITKADGTKYYQYGTYVADDGDTTTGETTQTYLCKSYDVENASYTSSEDNGVTVYTVTSAKYTGTDTQWAPGEGDSYTGGTLIDGKVYYVDENGAVYTIVQKTDGIEVRSGFDFSDTTVAFAVVWKPELVEDTVVIDYGLDVVIDVTTNDAMSAGVTGVMLEAPKTSDGSDVITMNSGTYDTAVGSPSVNSTDGVWTASKESLTSVRFHMNEMGINAPATFYYEAGVNYYLNGELQSKNMYSSVTVIPATTVYYEDSFVTYTNSSNADGTYGTWTVEGSTINATQDVDRPGVNKISEAYDADNLYGYDSAYESMATYSMGSAHKVTVKEGVSGKASFSFYGTGFDVISLTDNTSGAIIVQVKNSNNEVVKSLTVNNYYGYTYEAGEWKLTDSNDPNALYQVPVMKVEGLDYGKYTVDIVASYNLISDVTKAGSYTFILDAIRIYDPCGTTYDVYDEDGNVVTEGNIADEAQAAYIADGEGWPVYKELRNLVIEDATELADITDTSADSDATIEGAVFIDGYRRVASIEEYKNYGPNNELYLAPGQGIAFTFDDLPDSLVDVQLAVKNVNGNAKLSIFNPGSTSTTSTTDGVTTITTFATKDNLSTIDVKTTTDMYYSIIDNVMDENKDEQIIVIHNSSSMSGDSPVVSITNLKFTFNDETEATIGIAVNNAVATAAQQSLALYRLTTVVNSTIEEENEEPKPEVKDEPEVKETEPEVKETEPEVKETEPEVEETKPEVKETEPEVKETEPEVKETEPKVEETKPEVKETEPEVKETEPEVEETEPEVEETKPKVTETEPKVEETKPEVKETEPEVKETEPEVKETEPEVKETEPEVEETEPEVEETDPEVEETEPEVKETEPKVEETQPEVKETEPEVKETEPEVKETEPKVEETKPEVKETEPKVEETKPEVKETEPEVKETEPEVKETEPEVEETEPEVKETEPKVEETKPEVKETEPEVEEVPTNNTNGFTGVMNNIRNAITSLFKTLFGWLIG